MSTFDELFNDFFGKNEKPKKSKRGRKPKQKPKSGFMSDMKESFEDVIKAISNIKPITDKDEQFEIDNNFGEPDSLEYYEEDGLFFRKSTWFQEDGEIVKLEVSNESFDVEESKSLEQLLKTAVEEENYEKAAELRDKIEKNKNN